MLGLSYFKAKIVMFEGTFQLNGVQEKSKSN